MKTLILLVLIAMAHVAVQALDSAKTTLGAKQQSQSDIINNL